MARILVTGAGGAIGGHLTRRLLDDGHDVAGIDIKPREQWWQIHEGLGVMGQCDLRKPNNAITLGGFDEVYHLACAMGGRGFIEENETACAMNAAMDMHVLDQCVRAGVKRFFYASTACVYPTEAQSVLSGMLGVSALRESLCEARIAEGWSWNPDSVYGAQKLFTEVAIDAFARANPNTAFRIARFHGVFGEHGSWNDGTEKAPAALMRKAIESALTDKPLEVWGDGTQRRSFLHVSEAVEGMVRLMTSDYPGPVNIGSDSSVTINDLALACQSIAGFKDPTRTAPVKFISGHIGPHSRNSDNTLIEKVLGWRPTGSLIEGLVSLHAWMRPLMDENWEVDAS